MNVPKALRDIAPQLISTPKGDAWVMAPGAQPRLVSTSAVAGRKKDEYLSKPVTYAGMRKGSFEPGPRLEDMDIDHIDGDVMYPGIMRYLERCANSDVRMACSQAYNEWIADFCKFNPKRLVGVGVLPILEDDGGKAAIKALKAAAKLGLKTAFLSQKDGGMPVHHPDADAFWATAAELGMPISLHIHTNPFIRGMTPEITALPGSKEMGPSTVLIAMAEHLALMMFGGVFMRHPNLKVVFAEGGIGWIPSVLERMDHVFKVHRPYMGSPITELPSDTFRRQCYATFQVDISGIRLRDMMGVDQLMWASDYPHTDTTWPESKQVIDKTFEGVPETDKRKMVCENAARLYGFTH
jgi:predicted TIM-barrel fold metal-dependent hydrolase